MTKKTSSSKLIPAFILFFLISSGCTNTFMEQILKRKDNTDAAVAAIVTSYLKERPYTGPAGSGVPGDPFIVYNAETLQKVGSETGPDTWNLQAHYMQIGTIDMKGKTLMPIGTGTGVNSFSGSYDGNHGSITNLGLTGGSDSNYGLFGHISGKVAGVSLKNVTLNTTGNYAGAVVGYNDGGTVQGCTVMAGSVSGTSDVGGVVGYNDGGTVQGCVFSGQVYGVYEAGGVVGYNNGSSALVKYCYAAGSVTGTVSPFGGVAGINTNGTIESCYAVCDVSGMMNAGGIVGSVVNGRVQNCYATGSIKSTGLNAGGVAGYLVNGTVENCYASGNVTGMDNTGGVAGSLLVPAVVRNCVALNEKIKATAGSGTLVIGRVVGNDQPGQHINNYGRANMTLESGSSTQNATPNINGHDGDDVGYLDYTGRDWWMNPATWASPAWNFTAIWEWKSYPPVLRYTGP